jgi:molybdopterin converting factor subunit 1
MKVKVRCFAACRDITGKSQMELELPGGTSVAGLLRIIHSDYPKLSTIVIMVAVNAEYAVPERLLREGDEVALIPPVSGG